MASTIFQIDYLGRCKYRSNGSESAFGMVQGQWSVIFPKYVLFDWFGINENPSEQSNLYHVLGIKPTTAQADIKKAYRKMAKQWHPDHCKETDAADQFQRIQSAYEILQNQNKRAKYDAGLKLQATLSPTKATATKQIDEFGWRAPLRCGLVFANFKQSGRWQVVEEILQWEDIVNSLGQTMVASWIYGDKEPVIDWA